MIPLRVLSQRPPSCHICIRAAVDADGQTICTDVGEVIDAENVVALTCDYFEEDPDAR